MKLIECHIDNFGCLQNFDYRFRPGLNTLLAPNGFGKSTLAAFLKAMFYGFPRGSSRSLEKNPRKKFFPWQGGAFGGWLRFEAQGREFTLYRSFGTTPGNDSFRLLEGSNPSSAYGADIGQILFGVDAESFDRCLYLPQQAGDTFATGDIHARLAALVYNTDDVEHYENARKKLQERRMYYRHYRGSGGQITAQQELVFRLERELAVARDAHGALEDIHPRLEQLRHSRETLLSRRRSLEANSPEELAALEQSLAQDRQILDDLERKYPQGIPQEEELILLGRNRHRIRLLKQQLEQLPPEENPLPPAVEEAFSRLSDPQAALTRCGIALEEMKARPSGKKTFPRKTLFLILACLLTAAGILLSFGMQIPGIAVAGGGLICLMIALNCGSKKGASVKSDPAREQVQTFLAAFPLDIADPEEKLSRLRQLYTLHREAQLRRSERESLQAQLDTLEAQTPGYPEEAEADAAIYERTLNRWEQSRNRLAQAQRRSILQAQALQELEQDMQLLESQMNDLLRRQLLLETQAGDLAALEAQLAAAKEKLQQQQTHCLLLDKAVSLLDKARDGLRASYGSQVEAHFAVFARELLGDIGAALGADLTPGIQGRSLDAFSPGITDSIRLCIHLALTESLFPGEKPPLILDDPFVNLDAENLHRARQLLDKAAQSRQLLHLTCHESRI